MPEGKHAGQRIKENLQSARAQAEALRLELVRGGAAPDRPLVANDGSLDYALFRAMEASRALTLLKHEHDEAITKAFSEAKLDHENPWHWRVLLNVFAEAYFPRRNSNQFWNYARLTELAAAELRSNKNHPRWKKEQHYKALKKWVAKRYGKNIELISLSKLLRHAKDRKINKHLEFTYQEIVRDWTEILEKHKAKISNWDLVIEGIKGRPSSMELATAAAESRMRFARTQPEPDKK